MFVPDTAEFLDSGMLLISFTDHNLVYCFKNTKVSKKPHKFIKSRNWKNYDSESFHSDCAKFSFTVFFAAQDMDAAWVFFFLKILC